MTQQTLIDQLSSLKASTTRTFNDLNMDALGTATQILRIIVGAKDDWGEGHDDVESILIDKAYIKHTFASRVEAMSYKDTDSGNLDTTAINVWDFLPWEVKIPFEGNQSEKPVELKKGDLIIWVMLSAHNNKIPIILKITREYLSTAGKYTAGRIYEACLERGTLDDNIQKAVDDYINNLE